MSPVVLVILIAWALLSVIFLTGTLLAARSIDRSVSGVTNRTGADGKPEKNIQTTVEEIGREGKFIDEARKTVQISTAIRKAAAPLSASLGRTLETADKGIDPKLKRILGKVNDINGVAGEINTTVLGIGSTVDSIFTNVISISNSVKSVDSDVAEIRMSARQIDGSARSILGSLGAVLTVANNVNRNVKGINTTANNILTTAQAILVDFNGIRANVGIANGTNTVVGHANGVDCSILLLGTQGCNR
jgi:methyl-accepting chemotaxis protein